MLHMSWSRDAKVALIIIWILYPFLGSLNRNIGLPKHNLSGDILGIEYGCLLLNTMLLVTFQNHNLVFT